MNILYYGVGGTSGYAIATKYFIFNYLVDGHNVAYRPQKADNSNMEDCDIITRSVNECINRKYNKYEYLIIHRICNIEPFGLLETQSLLGDSSCKKIMQTVWETTKLPENWVNIFNECNCDEMWVPSRFNKIVFEECGVKKPVKIRRYVSYNIINNKEKFALQIPYHIKYGNADFKNTYNFYYISTWNERKNNVNTLKTFCDTFTSKDNVSFLMKAHDYYYNDEFIKKIRGEIEEVLKNYSTPPTIVLFPYNYSISQLNDIHNLGDCYFLLSRAEGLGFGCYDAYLNHKPVIVTKFGGHVEYFPPNYPYFIDYKLIKVFGMKTTLFYQHDHEWAEPNYDQAKAVLREMYTKSISNIPV